MSYNIGSLEMLPRFTLFISLKKIHQRIALEVYFMMVQVIVDSY